MDFTTIFRPEVRQFIKENIHKDLTKLLLSNSPFEDISMQQIAQQIKGCRIAEKKFPFLLKEGIVFPPQLNLEQSSSQATAIFKASLFGGESLLDLTCGYGIDAYYLSENFKATTLVEQNRELLDIVKHNWSILNKTHVLYLHQEISFFLQNNTERFSLIYLDPARRDMHNHKKFLLKDLSPDIINIGDELLKFSDKILIKLSPLMDISMLISQVKAISYIYIIAVKNEVKELLIVIDKAYDDELSLRVCNLQSNDPDLEIPYSALHASVASYGEVSSYLYIPNNALLKSGAFNFISEYFQLEKLHPNTQLYTSNHKIENFPGRVLKIVSTDAKAIKKGERFNIIAKNYPLTPEQIKKKYKIKDGGNQYLIFTQSRQRKLILKSI
ncbi:methyltransferase [Elizabethkingia argentiflava]|uniref:Methyltransferase n=1 Tax=Elizabethkingia argenteiflava TaxID=2681556 RepID=A0A845PRW0_9FLAO|nr:class I SAM-dependent methyltransferase [Elizabethkingia argenteiflava]NAW51009.1 methyltransferase [Elizabethkingia argenteiflava]